MIPCREGWAFKAREDFVLRNMVACYFGCGCGHRLVVEVPKALVLAWPEYVADTIERLAGVEHVHEAGHLTVEVPAPIVDVGWEPPAIVSTHETEAARRDV